jgi:hypothetical protein
MLEILKELPPGIDGVQASGRVTREDYDRVLEPLLERARHDTRRIRFLYQLGPTFEGFTAAAAVEDAWIGLRHLRLFDGCAVVGDVGWIREAAHLVGALMPCPLRVFGNAQFPQAVAWLAQLDASSSLAHCWLSEKGVLVAEPSGPLRAADFDRLAAVIDPWIDAHGGLSGLVIHARAFPGWENLNGLIAHILFGREHRGRIKKIALCVDGKLAELAPQLAKHFMHAEVEHFAYGREGDALAWVNGLTEGSERAASRGTTRQASPPSSAKHP